MSELELLGGGPSAEGEVRWATWAPPAPGGRMRYQITHADPRVTISDELYDAAVAGRSPFCRVAEPPEAPCVLVSIWDDFGAHYLYRRGARVEGIGWQLEWPD